MIPRKLHQQILQRLGKRKAIILTGARQVGKTTLATAIAHQIGGKFHLWNCDEPDIRAMLTNASSTRLKELVGKATLVVIDEAQRVPDIGLVLKLMTDTLPNLRLIVTGSSAFALSQSTNEPLTGRKFEFVVYPVASVELAEQTSAIEEQRLLEQRLLYGLYPDVVQNLDDAPLLLRTLTTSYLYKDIFTMNDVRKPEVIERLVTALALQLGSEVSYNELARTVGVDKETIVRYIDLLERAFVIYRLSAFSRNMRKELTQTRKIYFYDNGIRNALIANFQPIELRTDKGALWENYLMTERRKLLSWNAGPVHQYFWRTHDRQELDYIEESGGEIFGYEFKWGAARVKIPKGFMAAYPNSLVRGVNRQNYWEFIAQL